MINLCTNKLHLPRLKAVVHMHRTSEGHRTIDVTTGLTPATFRVPEEIPQQYGLTWDQIVTRSMVENVAQDVRHQFVAKGETENVSRAESTDKQRGKISRQTVHSPPHQGSITINHQDMSDGQENDHPHLIKSHFFKDAQERDNPSSSLYDIRPFPHFDAITSVDLATWDQMSDVTTRGDDRCARLTRGVKRIPPDTTIHEQMAT